MHKLRLDVRVAANGGAQEFKPIPLEWNGIQAGERDDVSLKVKSRHFEK